MAYLELDPGYIERGDKLSLFLGSAYREFGHSFGYSDFEMASSSDSQFNASPYLDLVEQVGHDMNDFYQTNNQRVVDKIGGEFEGQLSEGDVILPTFEWNEQQRETFTRTMWENVAEGAGAFVPMLVELAAITVATEGTMTMVGLTSMLSRMRSANLAYKAATKTKGIKSVFHGTRVVDGVSVTRGANLWNRAQIGFVELSLEEMKMQIAGFKPGSGASFYMGGKFTQWMRIPTYRLTDATRFKSLANLYNYGSHNLLNPIFQKIVKPGVVGAASMELASIVELKLETMSGVTGKTFEKEMQRMFVS